MQTAGSEQLAAREAGAKDAPGNAGSRRATTVPSATPSLGLHPRALGLQHQLQRYDGGRLDAARARGCAAPVAPGTALRGCEGGEEKGSCRPLCSPGSLSPGREGKATSVAELTPLEREWVVIAWPLTAQAAKPSVVRQTPKFPGTGHRQHSRSHRRGHRHAVSATVI